MESFLTIPEEFYLLTVDEKIGQPVDYDDKTFNIVFAASLLVELSLTNRIDTDFEHVIPDKNEPTGNSVLDIAFEEIHSAKKQMEISYWILKFADKAADLRQMTIEALVRKRVLQVKDKKVLWMFSSRKYPVKDKEEVTEVKQRLKDLIRKAGEIPEFRDVALLSLLYYGSMLQAAFTQVELKKYQKYIKHFARMDVIGSAISKALEEVTLAYKLHTKAKEMLSAKTPEQKIEELIEIMSERHGFEEEVELPDWLRKGTEQYQKTLDFITENNTNNIVFNPKTKEHKVKKYSAGTHVFGSGV